MQGKKKIVTRITVKEMLDDMLPPFKQYQASIKANRKIKNRKGRLLDLIADLERNNGEEYLDEHKLEEKLEQIIEIADPRKKKEERKNMTTPFLIKQALFYLNCRCLQCDRCKATEREKRNCKIYNREHSCGITQKSFLNKLGEHGFKVSHNFFSRMGITPESYMLTKAHKQINPPFPYPGQKKDELGVAIRELAYQAGKYTKYVDVFGGSGAACSAIPKKERVTYYYNEKNCNVENLFEVLADDKLYKELIIELTNIVKHIKGTKHIYKEVDFDKEIRKYHTDNEIKMGKKEKEICKESSKELTLSLTTMDDFLKAVHEDVEKRDKDFVFKYNGERYTKWELWEMSKPGNYMAYFSLFAVYDEKYMQGKALGKVEGKIGGKTVSLDEKNKQYTQYQCYCLYLYFLNLLRRGKIGKRNRVKYAAAEFCHLSFSAYHSDGVLPILEMIEKEEEGNPVLQFLKQDLKKDIEGFHKQIRRFHCSEKDFHDIFMEHDSSNTLFYIDAPYAENADYKDPQNKLETFEAKKRKQLFEDMKNAKGKVIYSCRAAKNSISKQYTEAERSEINRKIANDMFGPFFNDESKENNEKKWYVLAIEKKANLTQLLKKNKVAEVMLTNFEIQSFDVEGVPNVHYQVYQMKEFMLEILNNIDLRWCNKMD